MSVGHIFAILVCSAFAVIVIRACRVVLREEWLPKELRAAELVYSEQLFSGSEQVPIVARVDRVYLAKGQLHLVELKTRLGNQVYETDVIELSAQRVAVQASTGMDVSSKATVVIEHPVTGRRVIKMAQLLTEKQIFGLMQRRRTILGGLERPRDTHLRARCAMCEYRSECKGEDSARVYPLVRS